MIFAFNIRHNLDLCISFTMMHKNLTCWHTLVNKGTSFWWSESSWINFSSGKIYLRLKSYLVGKISSNIVTEHWCQVCVQFMMFYRSDCRWCAWWVIAQSGKLNSTWWFDFILTGHHRKWYEKYLSLIFAFYLNRDTSVLELFPVVVFQ